MRYKTSGARIKVVQEKGDKTFYPQIFVGFRFVWGLIKFSRWIPIKVENRDGYKVPAACFTEEQAHTLLDEHIEKERAGDKFEYLTHQLGEIINHV